MGDERPVIAFDLATPAGEDRLRRVCRTCGFIDYVNPRIVAGSVAVDAEGKVLLCRRAIDPRKGFWTLPAGFMEEGESVEEAALREAREEAMADLQLDGLLALYSIPRISQVQVMFRAKLMGAASPGPESLEVKLFEWDDIPWSELAFPSVKWALEHWRDSRDKAVFTPYGNPPGTEAMTRASS
jgi:ADP-ribose pyrophosphatase YjhB (NUDIX family)